MRAQFKCISKPLKNLNNASFLMKLEHHREKPVMFLFLSVGATCRHEFIFGNSDINSAVLLCVRHEPRANTDLINE